MKKIDEILYYSRLSLFIISLIINFLMIGTFVKVGLFGYIYLFFEFIYISVIITMILSKKKRYKNDTAFNTMQIGTYIYQSIVYIRTFSWKLSSFSIDSYNFYRNNCIILSVLVIVILFYAFAINGESKINNKFN